MDDVNQFEIKGWHFKCKHGQAVSSHKRLELSDELGLKPMIPLPEIVFDNSFLTIKWAAKSLQLSFSVVGALAAWRDENQEEIGSWDHTSFDYTYRSNYGGDIAMGCDTKDKIEIIPSEEQIPLEKLQQRVEILYYDHVILFEDDVRDLGEIYTEAKIRVMHFGFLVLCRYYCRVDEKIVKMIDTRYYHEFGKDFIWRDRQVREARVSLLRQRLCPSFNTDLPNQQFQPSDLGADVVYQAIAPKLMETHKIRVVADDVYDSQ